MISEKTIADLHIHSTASDSTFTPAEIVAELVDKKIGICSLTDHDNIDNQVEFLNLAKETGLHAIPGVEVSSKIDDMVYHILAYGFAPENIRVSEFVDPLLDMMKAVNRTLIVRMSSDYPDFDIDEYDAYSYGRRRGGWESVQYIHDKGLTEIPLDGLSFYREYNCLLSDCPFPHPSEVIDEIHSWGAYAVLAHPNGYFKSRDPDPTEIRDMLEMMKYFKMDGVECHYPTHTDLMTSACLKWCR